MFSVPMDRRMVPWWMPWSSSSSRVTHDAVAASYADRAIVFSDGRIVADEQHPNA